MGLILVAGLLRIVLVVRGENVASIGVVVVVVAVAVVAADLDGPIFGRCVESR